MIKIGYVLISYVLIYIVTSSPDHLNRKIKSCHIGDVVQNECNKCLCTSKGIFECKPTKCDRTKELMWSEENFQQTCSPNELYVNNLIICICTKHGTWPHKSCYKSFQSLPTKNIQTHRCEPNTYVMIDCNVCRCGPNGEFIKSRCTKNNCENDTVRNSRRNNLDTVIKNNSVYSTCKVKTWYSLAPCQFCYCINENKLVCNIGNNDNTNLAVDNYDLHICGKEFIREAEGLISDNHAILRSITVPYFSSEEQVTTTKNRLAVGKNIAIVNDESTENNLPIKSNIDKDVSDYKNNEHMLSNSTSNNSRIVTENIEPLLHKDEDSNSDQDSSGEYSNEISFDIDPLIAPSKTNDFVTPRIKPNGIGIEPKIDRPSDQKSIDVQNLQNSDGTLQINIPDILKKVLEMASRKSLVSLSSSTKCVPGATSMRDCNICFCLKNGKLLCTINKCK